jgi:hypothetical protein
MTNMEVSKIADYVEHVGSRPGNDDPLAMWPAILASAHSNMTNESY